MCLKNLEMLRNWTAVMELTKSQCQGKIMGAGAVYC